MAVCEWCKAEMCDDATMTCTGNAEVKFPKGDVLPSLPYIGEDGRRCHDCHVAPGGKHHPGCDKERCPKCPQGCRMCGGLEGHVQRNGVACRWSELRRDFFGGQLIGCGCLDE